MNVNDVTSGQNPARQGVVFRPENEFLQELLFAGCQPPVRSKAVAVALRLQNDPLVRLAELRGRLDQRIQHGLQVERRAADDLEHVGGGGLLLQRFPEIVGAFAQLAKQPRVLDGDDGLLG